MATKTKWTSTFVMLGKKMRAKGMKYNWKSSVNETDILKQSTCVGYVSLALQRTELLPTGKYTYLSGEKLVGTELEIC